MDYKLNIDWEEAFADCKEDVNKQWDIFLSKLKEAEKDCIPQKNIRMSKKKFAVPLDKKVLKKIKRKNRLWQRF